jgi:two-component system, response regulator PdtaR
MGQAERPLEHPFIALVVEDEPELRYLAGSVLEEAELEVAEAESGEEALSFLRERAPEVAIMFVDVNLPGKINGVDLAVMAAQFWPWIRVVVTSGGMNRPISDLPRTATFMPKPWRALDVLVEAGRAVGH